MNIYRDLFFPWCIEKIMSRDEFTKIRHRVLNHANGKILEIGFGTGLNLPCYSTSVESLATLDISEAMNKKAQRRVVDANFPVAVHALNSESLPMADNTFDCVVSTWTMCSINRLDLALEEIRRVLKANGRLLFAEHGLSPNPRIQAWQQRLTPLQKFIGCGCRLNRNIAEMIASQGFKLLQLERYQMDNTPEIHGSMYEGIAAIQ